MSRTMRSALSNDSGVAMLVVIGVMSIVTVLAIGSFALARQALHESEIVESSSRAFRAASSGLEQTLSTLTEETLSQLLIDGAQGATPDGQYVVSVEDLGRDQYQLVSRGAGADGSAEVVRQKFFFLNLWKMNLSTDSMNVTGGNKMNGNSTIIGPFYVKGTLNIDAGMSVFEGPLFVKTTNGSINKTAAASFLGHPDWRIDVAIDSGKVEGSEQRRYINSLSTSVPDILLPPLEQEHLETWAQIARTESIDNKMGSKDIANDEVTVDPSTGPDPASYESLYPGRKKATAAGDQSDLYKYFAANDGAISEIGMGTTSLTIGGASFGAWGTLSDVNGKPIASGVLGYPAGKHDDFAYDHVNSILYISGTVFVDGPVTFSKGVSYVGNGTLIANGPITVDGYLRPFGSSDYTQTQRNLQAQENKWALGLVTPDDIDFVSHDLSNPGGANDEDLRDSVKPAYSGAFYAAKNANFDANNAVLLGSLLTTNMNFKTLNFLITNPLLPSYLPDSLPGGDGGFLSVTQWSRD